MKWQRQPQEQKGNYFFSGACYVTAGVSEALSQQEIAEIILDLQRFVRQENGVDYLQVYTDGTGRKIFVIDQLSKEMLESGDYLPEYNHYTILFDFEY